MKIICQEEKTISSLEYNYDNQEATKEIINNTKVELEIPILEGEHDLTVKITYEDGKSKEKTQKIFFPEIHVLLLDNKEQIIIRIKDTQGISKIIANFNGKEHISNFKDRIEFEGRLTLREGNNKLTLTVENKRGVSITQSFNCNR